MSRTIQHEWASLAERSRRIRGAVGRAYIVARVTLRAREIERESAEEIRRAIARMGEQS